ncbi:MAG TPA: hypothetical protein PK200_01685, partial [Spirochaetota bacterium]|nr:hypothetical protein [Spirochaetota bacterium]
AVVMGLIPAICALAWTIMSSSFAIAGQNYNTITQWANFAYAHKALGFIAMERGFIITSMLWSTLTVFIIERKFIGAALTSVIMALCSWIGIIHTYQITANGQLLHRFMGGNLFQDQWQFAVAYLIVTVFFLYFYAKEKYLAKEEV